jgi:peroxiredoxin
MPIKVGDRLPEGTFTRMTDQGPAPMASKDLFAGKKVVLFAVPGAFTPTCSNKHLPGYLKQYDEFKKKGVDTIACMAVNDVWVMDAWGKQHGATGKIELLADGNGDYAKQLDLLLDLTKAGLGIRSKRFSLIADDGVVKELNVEPPGEFNASSAEATVCQL